MRVDLFCSHFFTCHTIDSHFPLISLPLSLHPPSHLLQQQERRIEDAIRSIRQQYEEVLEKKQEEYVEKYKHLQYIEVRRVGGMSE